MPVNSLRKDDRLKQTLEQAWIGDAVLCLYARSRILAEEGRIESQKFVRMTSNRFLAAVGEASQVEAEIGRVYDREGLTAAFRWIDENLMPQFSRQELNRKKRQGR
jgi:dsRNA-specific ribonuclease